MTFSWLTGCVKIREINEYKRKRKDNLVYLLVRKVSLPSQIWMEKSMSYKRHSNVNKNTRENKYNYCHK